MAEKEKRKVEAVQKEKEKEKEKWKDKMGFLDICKGFELLKYGSKNSSSGCECVNKEDEGGNIYTDGSLNPRTGQAGYGVYSPRLGIKTSKAYPYSQHKNNILRVESKAILEAVTDVKKNHKTRDRVDIFSDSENALTHLQVLKNGERPLPGDNNNWLGDRILSEVNKDDWKTEVHLHKVKAHSNNPGNDTADRLAKSGARTAPIIDPSLLSKPPSSKLVDDQIYSATNSAFSSCNKKRTRLAASDQRRAPPQSSQCPVKFSRRSSVSPSPPSKPNADRDRSRSTKGFFSGFFNPR